MADRNESNMSNEFQRLMISSSMIQDSYLSGQTYSVAKPCTVYAMYNESTGTILIESAWCNGRTYEVRDLSIDDLQKFRDEFAEAIAERLF